MVETQKRVVQEMISIVIPCRQREEALQCVKACNQLARKDIQIIVLPDELTGEVSPGKKRNMGIRLAEGELIAFIDADAYPDKYWLSYNASNVAGWCGPGLLPPQSTFHQRSVNWIWRASPYWWRVRKGKVRYVNDYPTFNLIIRKEVLELVGGFREDILTGEDSDLVARITDMGLKIVYIPQCVVYHRHKPLFGPFLHSIATYATHRGYLFKKGKGNSRKLVYCLPSLCLLLSILLLVILAL